MTAFHRAAGMAVAQTYYKITGLLLLGVLSRVLSAHELGLLLWTQALCESVILMANLNLTPNLMRRVAAHPEDAAKNTAPLLGLQLVGAGAYLLLFIGIAFAGDPARRPVLIGIAIATMLEDLYFLFGTLFIALGRMRYNITIGVMVQTLYIGAVWLLAPRMAALPTIIILGILRGAALLGGATILARNCVPGLRVGWSHSLWREQFPLMGSALLNVLRGRAETMVAGAVLGMTAAAPLGLAQRVVLAVGFLPSSAVAGIAPTLARDGRSPQGVGMVRWASIILVVIGMFLGAILLMAPGQVGHLLFGSGVHSSSVLYLVAPLLPLTCVEGLYIGVLHTWHREREVLQVGMIGLMIYLLLAAGFVPVFGMAGLLYAQIAAALLRVVCLGWKAIKG